MQNLEELDPVKEAVDPKTLLAPREVLVAIALRRPRPLLHALTLQLVEEHRTVLHEVVRLLAPDAPRLHHRKPPVDRDLVPDLAEPYLVLAKLLQQLHEVLLPHDIHARDLLALHRHLLLELVREELDLPEAPAALLRRDLSFLQVEPDLAALHEVQRRLWGLAHAELVDDIVRGEHVLLRLQREHRQELVRELPHKAVLHEHAHQDLELDLLADVLRDVGELLLRVLIEVDLLLVDQVLSRLLAELQTHVVGLEVRVEGAVLLLEDLVLGAEVLDDASDCVDGVPHGDAADETEDDDEEPFAVGGGRDIAVADGAEGDGAEVETENVLVARRQTVRVNPLEPPVLVISSCGGGEEKIRLGSGKASTEGELDIISNLLNGGRYERI